MKSCPLYRALAVPTLLLLAFGPACSCDEDVVPDLDIGPVVIADATDAAGLLDEAGNPIDVGPTNDDGGGGTDGPPTGTDAETPAGDGGVTDRGPRRDAGTNTQNPNNPTLDTDCDGLSDQYEFATVYPGGGRTDPGEADSDGDGIPDGVEVGVTGPVANTSCPNLAVDADPASRTSPSNPDSDGDGLPDGVEDANKNGRVDPGETNPNSADSDGDGIADGIEDSNRNGVRDANETSASSRDTDGDGIADGLEDADRNGMRDPGETDPRAADSDGDGIPDGMEDTNHDGTRQPNELDPRTPDTDCDGVGDNEELMMGTSPLVGDSDGDGIADGIEAGRTMPLPMTTCPAFVPDADPTTTTDPRIEDTDMDGIPDGMEDTNQNGRLDQGETDARVADSDMDGIPDGDERRAGTDPLDRNDPNPTINSGIATICSERNLKVVDFDVSAQMRGDWTVANETSYAYTALTNTSTHTFAAALDDTSTGIAAFVLEMPLIPGFGRTAALQAAGVVNRLTTAGPAEAVVPTVRQSPRSATSHDGYEIAVSGVIDVNATLLKNASGVRNSLLKALSPPGVGAGWTGLPTAAGVNAVPWAFSYQVLVRPAAGRVLVLGGVQYRNAFDDAADSRSIALSDLTNGTALARAGARRDKGCDPFDATGVSIADFIWMSDVSGSTDDDRGRIQTAAQQVFGALRNNGVDFRMAVVPHPDNDRNPSQGVGGGGDFRGAGFITDETTFITYLDNNLPGLVPNGCEFGLTAVDNAIAKALPRTATTAPVDPRKIRGNATLAVVYISDEHAQELEMPGTGSCPAPACATGIGDAFPAVGLPNGDPAACMPAAVQQACVDSILAPFLRRLRDNNAIAFAQIVDPNPAGLCTAGQFRCQGSQQDRNEPGRGYLEMVNATGGTFYSPCNGDPGPGPLAAIVDAVSGAASEFQLRGSPISSTIKVGLTRAGQTMTATVPRAKQEGFDYDPVSNSIFFRGTMFRPARGDRVTISYRVWLPPEPPCGGACTPNQICDPQLGVCTCDQGACTTNCGPNQVCDASCQCVCAPDCNGQCAGNTTCNPATCACECPADCGGCPTGTACNRTTCACECAQNCAGACANAAPLVCDQADCACECPSDCGGTCAAGRVCNTSTCGCDCDPNCSSRCSGQARCDPTADCQCVCPADCGGCPDNTVCNPTSCLCECAANCEQGCTGRRVCDPASGCGCICPPNCGGCGANETCDPVQCVCTGV